jgi:hypothetical protein
MKVRSARVDANTDVPSPEAAPGARSTRPRWLGQVPRDVILIVLGATLAFASEEWRTARQRSTRVDITVASLRDELKVNRELVTVARDHHRQMSDTLGKLLALHLRPDVGIYSNGMWNPALVTSTAWQAARETGALGDLPLATVLGIAPAYEVQDRYRAATEAMSAAIMNDVRRDGMDAVLRDRFAQFVPLDADYASREAHLLEAYGKALSHLSVRR